MSLHTGIEPNKEIDVLEPNLPSKNYVDDELKKKVDKACDTITGPLSMDDSKIWDLTSGTLDTNAVNKKYVDDQDVKLQTKINLKVSKWGNGLTGELDMNDNKITDLATPSNNTDAANKKYVDDQDALKISNAVVLDNSFTASSAGYVQHKVLSSDIDTVVRKHFHMTYDGPTAGFSQAESLGGKQSIAFGGFNLISGMVAFANIKVRGMSSNPPTRTQLYYSNNTSGLSSIRGHLTNALKRTLSDGLHILDTKYNLHFENMTYILVCFKGPNTRRSIDFDLIIDYNIET